MTPNFLFPFPLLAQLVFVANSAPRADRKYEQLESQAPNCAGGKKIRIQISVKWYLSEGGKKIRIQTSVKWYLSDAGWVLLIFRLSPRIILTRGTRMM